MGKEIKKSAWIFLSFSIANIYYNNVYIEQILRLFTYRYNVFLFSMNRYLHLNDRKTSILATNIYISKHAEIHFQWQ